MNDQGSSQLAACSCAVGVVLLLQVVAAASTVGSRVTWRVTALTHQQDGAQPLHMAVALVAPLALGVGPLRPLHAAWQAVRRQTTGHGGALVPASSVARRGTWLGSAHTLPPARKVPRCRLHPLCATTVGRRATTRGSAHRAPHTGVAQAGGPASTAGRRATWHGTALHRGVVGGRHQCGVGAGRRCRRRGA